MSANAPSTTRYHLNARYVQYAGAGQRAAFVSSLANHAIGAV